MKRRETYATFALCASLLLHGAIFFALIQFLIHDLSRHLNYPALPDHQSARSYAVAREESQLPQPDELPKPGELPKPPELPRPILRPPHPPQIFGMPDGHGESINASPGDVPAISRYGEQDQAALSRDPIGSGLMSDNMGLTRMFPGGKQGAGAGGSAGDGAPETPQAAAPLAPFGVAPAEPPPAPQPKPRPARVASSDANIIGIPALARADGPADKPDQEPPTTRPATQPDLAKPNTAVAVADPQPTEDTKVPPTTRPDHPPTTRPMLAEADATKPAPTTLPHKPPTTQPTMAEVGTQQILPTTRPDPSSPNRPVLAAALPHDPTPTRTSHAQPAPGAAGAAGGPIDGPASAGIVAPPAMPSDSDSDPFSTKAVNVSVSRLGSVEARHGRQVKAVRPKLTLKAWNDLALMARPLLVLKLVMDPTGKVIDVSIVHSSGSTDVDQPVYLAAWEFWIEPPKDRNGKPIADATFLTISFR